MVWNIINVDDLATHIEEDAIRLPTYHNIIYYIVIMKIKSKLTISRIKSTLSTLLSFTTKIQRWHKKWS